MLTWTRKLFQGLCVPFYSWKTYDDAMLEIKMSSKTLVYLEISTKCSIRFCAQRANAKKAERELNMQWHKPSNSCIFRIHKFHVWIMMISYNSYYWIRGRRKCRICTHFIIIQMERERGKLGIIISIETNKLCVLHAHINTLNFSQNPPLMQLSTWVRLQSHIFKLIIDSSCDWLETSQASLSD